MKREQTHVEIPRRQADHVRVPPSPGYRPVARLHHLFAVIFFQQLLQGRCILCGQVESECSSKVKERVPRPSQQMAPAYFHIPVPGASAVKSRGRSTLQPGWLYQSG